MLKDLVVYGASWHGREVMQVCRDTGMYMGSACFLDDGLSGRKVDGIDVFSGYLLHEGSFIETHRFIVAIGNNQSRLRIGNDILAKGGEIETVVHPSALVWPHAEIGIGTVIFPRAIVSVAAKVGRFCIVNKHATIGHGTVLGDGANISDSCAMSGNVGTESFMGLHAVAIPGVDIGDRCIVGAGAAVVRSVPDDTTVVGVPARAL